MHEIYAGLNEPLVQPNTSFYDPRGGGDPILYQTRTQMSYDFLDPTIFYKT